MRFSEDVLISIFEKYFDDKIENIYSTGFSISFDGEEFLMKYNFLEGYITFKGRNWSKIGTIFISECNISYEINPSNPFGYYVGLFEHELKKFIKSNQKRSRRKFISR